MQCFSTKHIIRAKHFVLHYVELSYKDLGKRVHIEAGVLYVFVIIC